MKKRTYLLIFSFIIILFLLILSFDSVEVEPTTIEECESSPFLGQCYHHFFCSGDFLNYAKGEFHYIGDDVIHICDNISYPMVNCYTEIARHLKDENICARMTLKLETKYGENNTVPAVEVLPCVETMSRAIGYINISEAKELCIEEVK